MSITSIRAAQPKATVLNKSLIITATAISAFVTLFSLFSIFHTSVNEHKQTIIRANAATQLSSALATLPQNYQDINRRKQFEDSQATISQTQNELEALRMQTNALQRELANLQNKSTSITTPAVDQNIMEARKSSLFFNTGSSSFNQEGIDKGGFAKTDYNQQNMQPQKISFDKTVDKQGEVYNPYTMITPASPYQIMAGTVIPANLLTAIDTSLPGDIVAQIRKDIYDTVRGEYLLIPKGSKVLGKYDSTVAYGQTRILIVFDRVIRPDGTSIQFSNFNGGDRQGSSGFNADVDNHWGKVLGAATISTLLSVGAGVAADRNIGRNPYYPTAQQGAILGAANSFSQVGQTITNRAVNVQPTLNVPVGYTFDIMINKDIILSPYHGVSE